MDTIERRADRLAVTMNVDASVIFSWCVAFAGVHALKLATMDGVPADQIDTLVALVALVARA